MRGRLWGWAALWLLAGCTDFVEAATDGALGESGASSAAADSSSSLDTSPTTGSATTTSSSTATVTTTAVTTNATDPTTSSSTGAAPETTDASGTTRGTDAATSESTGASSTCGNVMLDGDETDVDCGGSCTACEFGDGCEVGTDCTTGFCPSSLQCGLQDPLVWLDALDADTLYNEVSCTDSPPTPGQQVYCWENKGSHGGFFVDDGDQPIYRQAQDGMEFDNNTMLSTDPVFAGPLGDVTVFLVQEELASRNSFDFNLNHPSENGSRYSAHVPWGTSNRRIIFDIGGSGGGARVATTVGVVEVGETHVFTFVNSLDDDERLIHIDGTQEASEVGARSSEAGVVSVGNGARTLVHEFRVYSPSPTPAARQLIEGQLACRWGLRDQLGAAHPFYDAVGDSETGCPPSL